MLISKDEVIDSDVEGSADDDDDNDDDEGEDDMESEDGMEAEENMSSQGFEELGDDVPEEITDEDRKRYENGISDEGRKSKVAASEVFLRRLVSHKFRNIDAVEPNMLSLLRQKGVRWPSTMVVISRSSEIQTTAQMRIVTKHIAGLRMRPISRPMSRRNESSNTAY